MSATNFKISYFNKDFGLILEDMHDVIQKNGSLFFIDTVFYISR
jgi:hypothetical protein